MKRFIFKHWILMVAILVALSISGTMLYINSSQFYQPINQATDSMYHTPDMPINELSASEFERTYFNSIDSPEEYYYSLGYFYSLPPDMTEQYLSNISDSAFNELMKKEDAYIDYLSKIDYIYESESNNQPTRLVDTAREWIDLIIPIIEILTPLLIPVLTYRLQSKYRNNAQNT